MNPLSPRAWLALLALLALTGCPPDSTGDDDDDSAMGDDDDSMGDDDDDSTAACSYPDANKTMEVGETLYPYSWPVAIRPDGSEGHLDLNEVHCNEDDQTDWSVHDALVFVSIPAW